MGKWKTNKSIPGLRPKNCIGQMYYFTSPPRDFPGLSKSSPYSVLVAFIGLILVLSVEHQLNGYRMRHVSLWRIFTVIRFFRDAVCIHMSSRSSFMSLRFWIECFGKELSLFGVMVCMKNYFSLFISIEFRWQLAVSVVSAASELQMLRINIFMWIAVWK